MDFSRVSSGVRAFILAAIAALAVTNCAAEPETEEDSYGSDQIVGANAVGRRVTVQGHVVVPVGATNDTIAVAVRSQMRVLFGAARSINVGLSERQPIINTASFVREPITVIDPARPTATPRAMLRVRYTYKARAVVPRAIAGRA